jgi:UDP-N-acetyl-2-amino-2-deoxyglucuronate dehydrogenase
MIETAKSKNLTLGTFFQMRFNEASQKAKEMVDNGELGKIIHAQVNVLWYRNQEYYNNSPWRGKWATEGGGSLINQSCHSIDLMIWLVGQPKTVFGFFGAKTHDIEVDDNSATVVRFENDAYATIQTSTSLEPGYTNKVNIFGDKGGISIVGNSLTITHQDGTIENLDFEKQVGSASDPKLFSMKAQNALIKDFIGAVENKRPPLVDGKEGLRAIEVIQAIYKSNGERVIHI